MITQTIQKKLNQDYYIKYGDCITYGAICANSYGYFERLSWIKASMSVSLPWYKVTALHIPQYD